MLPRREYDKVCVTPTRAAQTAQLPKKTKVMILPLFCTVIGPLAEGR